MIYVWKSIHGHVPSMGLSWKEHYCPRKGPTLEVPTIRGKTEAGKNLQRGAPKAEGVRLFNSLPTTIRTFQGTPESFKVQLDSFLQCIPDQPAVDGLVPAGKDVDDRPSNSVRDWIRTFPPVWTPDLDPLVDVRANQ